MMSCLEASTATNDGATDQLTVVDSVATITIDDEEHLRPSTSGTYLVTESPTEHSKRDNHGSNLKMQIGSEDGSDESEETEQPAQRPTGGHLITREFFFSTSDEPTEDGVVDTSFPDSCRSNGVEKTPEDYQNLVQGLLEGLLPAVPETDGVPHGGGYHAWVSSKAAASGGILPKPSTALLQGTGLFHRLDSHEEVFSRKPPKILHGYLFGELVGEGSYSKVKECLDHRTLKRKAVKIIKLLRIRKIPNGLQNVQREMRLLQRLKHRNVIHLYEVFKLPEKQKLYLVFVYCVGSLQEMQDQSEKKYFPQSQAHDYFLQLIEGLEYLHSQGVVHKDIKPGNLLITNDDVLKISDMGVAEELSKFAPDDICSVGAGTPKFQPPEITSGHTDTFHGFPVDVWAAGVTLYNLVSSQYPFDGDAILRLYENIATKPLLMPTSVKLEDTLITLLEGMLEKDPKRRLTLAGIRKQAWFRRKPPRDDGARVPYPERSMRALTVYPFLEQLYSDECSTPPNAFVDHPMPTNSPSPQCLTLAMDGHGSGDLDVDLPPPHGGERAATADNWTNNTREFGAVQQRSACSLPVASSSGGVQLSTQQRSRTPKKKGNLCTLQ